MRRILTIVSACVLAGSVLVFADEFSVDFDKEVDFSTFKTFALRDGKVESARPELDNPLFVKDLGETIRAALSGRGLSETKNRSDLVVDYRVTGEDFSTTQRGAGNARMGIASPGPQSVRFTQGTLVIDIVRSGESKPIWRGVYRDDEGTGAKLVQKLPADAKKLLALYPPKPKR